MSRILDPVSQSPQAAHVGEFSWLLHGARVDTAVTSPGGKQLVWQTIALGGRAGRDRSVVRLISENVDDRITSRRVATLA